MPPVDQVNDFNQDRHLFLTVKQVDEGNPNIVHATVSTDEIDRYGEVVQPSAFKEALPAFLANPVVLPAHQHRLENGEPPVIGKVLTDTIRIGEHEIDLDIEFDDDDLGQKYAAKYRKRMMRAFSIGFRGLEGEYKDLDLPRQAAEATPRGTAGKTRVWIWTRIELLEVSAVAVPANRGALARALGFYESEEKNSIIHDQVTELLSQVASLTNSVNLCKSVSEEIRTDLEEIKTLLTPDQDGLARELLLGELDDPALPPAGNMAEQIERIKQAFSQ